MLEAEEDSFGVGRGRQGLYTIEPEGHITDFNMCKRVFSETGKCAQLSNHPENILIISQVSLAS